MSTHKGHIFFSTEVKPTPRAQVAQAVEAAQLETAEVRELSPRNVFIRAIRQLQRADVIEANSDGVLADRVTLEGDVAFQLSKRFVEANGVTYDPTALVRFNKTNAQIVCDNLEIQRLAERLYGELAGMYSVTDLHALTGRLIDNTGARRITLRPGVYFIARQYGDVLERISNLYKHLGYLYHAYPVTDTTDTRALAQAVVSDMVSTVAQIQAQIAEVRATSTDGVSKRLAKSKLRELKTSLAQYKELAASMGVSIKNLLEEAGTAGAVIEFAQAGDDVTALGALVQSGATLPALFTDLLESAEIVPLGGRDEIAPSTASDGDDSAAAVRDVEPAPVGVE